MQFAVVNSSKSLTDTDVEFFVAACQAQAVEFCQAYGLDPPAAALYSDVSKLPLDDVWICEITDSLDEPGALGYHSDVSNRPYIRVLAQGPQTSITLSHEFLELLGDPTCDRWAKRGDGTEVAVEVADPVEGDSYPQLAEVAGEGRTVEVSNYVLGSWFDPRGVAPFDRLGRLTAPFTMTPGGYMVVLDRGGNESEVFARVSHGGTAGIWAAGLRLAKVNGRLLRRLRTSRAPAPATLADGRHFKVSELASHGDDGQVPYPEEFADRLPDLMALLDAIRDAWGGPVEVVSGYRSPAHNAELMALDDAKGVHGVASGSQHVEGRAADLRPSGNPGQASALWQTVMHLYNDGNLPQLGGVGLYVKSGWVHVDTFHAADGHLRRWVGV